MGSLFTENEIQLYEVIACIIVLSSDGGINVIAKTCNYI